MRMALTCKQFARVLRGTEYASRFHDLTGKCKKLIFEKVVRDVRVWRVSTEREERLTNSKKFVQCKTVCRSWRYWIRRVTSGKEMRPQNIDIDI